MSAERPGGKSRTVGGPDALRTSPSDCPGFRFASVAAGIKKKAGAPDVGIIACDGVASCGAVFTRNRVKAAPVLASQAALRRSGGLVRAVVVNSGNANACTGAAGLADARRMAALAAAAVGAPVEQVLVASTGVIGHRLPMDRLESGIARAAAGLRADGFADFAAGILTTDRGVKMARARVTLGGGSATLIGCTKGAGMIAPNMATTLTFIATDARLRPAALQAAVRQAAGATFNTITVDGDTSTNDTLLVLAGGNRGRAASGPDAARFTAALTELCDELARALMRGGEGVHHVVTVRVTGAASAAAAGRVARAIATSPLVKTAIAGADPNWGRVLCAAGNAGVPLRPDRLALWVEDVPLAAGGVGAAATAEAAARTAMARPEYTLRLDLGLGRAEARCLACDLSHEYVTLNADYRT